MADDLTPEELEIKLKEYSAAVRAEFAEATENAANDETLKVHEYTQKFFKDNINTAAAQIVFLAQFAESETVRLKAASYVIERALLDAVKEGDPIKDLLNELSKTPNMNRNERTLHPDAPTKASDEEKSLIDKYVPKIRKGDEPQ